MIRKKFLFILLFVTLLNGCQSLRDGLEGNKKSKNAEEFLINKKNPLVLPPDFTKLPKPISANEDKNIVESFDLEKILKKKEVSTTKNKKNSSIKSKILKKINNN